MVDPFAPRAEVSRGFLLHESSLPASNGRSPLSVAVEEHANVALAMRLLKDERVRVDDDVLETAVRGVSLPDF